jgi:hypothetical protein
MTPTMTELTRIFKRVQAQTGVQMRANFTCCQSCGHAALGDHPRYAFYHQQDAQSAAHSGRLYVAFSCVDEDDTSTAEAVVAGLREAGCAVEWNGSARHRFSVQVEGTSFAWTHDGWSDDEE